MTTLLIVLLLPAMFGGRVESKFTFESKAQCERFYKQIKAFTVKHDVITLCSDPDEAK